MNLHAQIYEFASSAGALEGYVYHREAMDMKALPIWIGNLKGAYALIPKEVLADIQPFIDKTLGRAVRSLTSLLGEEHELVGAVVSMIKGPLPESPDDFQKKKWFQR